MFQMNSFIIWSEGGAEGLSLLLTPFVLLPDLLLLSRREVILDVERLPDLLRSLPLDHVRNSLAGHIQKTLDVQVVGSLGERGMEE